MYKNKSLRERFREVLPTIDVDRDHDPGAIIAATRDRSPEFLAHAWAACIEAAELSEEEVRYQRSHPFPVLARIGDPRLPRVIELLNRNV